MSGLPDPNLPPTPVIGDRSAPSRILLLLENEANRDRLSEWLSAEYDVLTPDARSLDEERFDLCIVDEPMLEAHHERLRSMKERIEPVFLPYLLFSGAETAGDPRVWNLVDEVVSLPTRKATLHNRLTNLLERRELSQQLSEDLDQQRTLFQRIFESSNDAIFVIDPDESGIRECNPQACDLLGYSREELLSLSPEDVLPDESPAFGAFLETVIDDGQGWTEELTCRTKDGNRLDAEISASAIDVDGRPHVLASVRDVTTRTEQRVVLNSLHDVTAELMRARTRESVAEITLDAAQRVFDYDIVGLRLLDDDTAPETLELVTATAETYDLLDSDPTAYEPGKGLIGEAFESGEAVIIDDLRSGAVPFDYGSIRSAMCFPLGDHGVLNIGATDTSAFDDEEFELTKILAANATAALTRAQREQALSERTEHLRGLFENTTDCIADVEFVDGTPRIRDVNPRFERVFGYSCEAIRGESLEELVVPPGERTASRRLDEHARAGNHIETEARRETATGRRDFLVRVVPMRDGRSNVSAYVVYTDITERKRRDEQLQVLNRVLRHNIRNKLNVVRGTVEKALEGEVPETLAKDGLSAVDDLLDLSETARELSKGTRPDDNLDPVSASRIVERTVESLDREYPDAEITTTLRSQGHVAGTVQLDQAVRELCQNAIEHSDSSTPSVSITVEAAEESADWLRLTVEDDGPGIPDEQRAVLRKGEETQLKHGNGLGLWAIHWIVTSAGGELSLRNTDSGAVVTLRLPTVGPDEQPQTGLEVIPDDE